MIRKVDAIQSLNPEVGFSFDYDKGITEWFSDKPQPTDAEINAEMIRLQNEYDSLQYQRDRHYATWQEQMDQQYWDQVNGTTTWKDAIAKVKADNPKGAE